MFIFGFSLLCQIIIDLSRLRRDFVRLSLCLLLNAKSALNLVQIAQGFIQLGLSNLQEWRLRSLSGQPVPLLGCVHGEFFVPFTCQNPYIFLNTHFIVVDFSVNMVAEYSHWILETPRVLLCSWIQQCVSFQENQTFQMQQMLCDFVFFFYFL